MNAPGIWPGTGNPDLEREGWQVRFVGSEPRLSEVAELYRDLGFAVRVEDYTPPPDCGECRTCLESAAGGLKVVWVKSGGSSEEER